jgi:hypothetical protein
MYDVKLFFQKYVLMSASETLVSFAGDEIISIF